MRTVRYTEFGGPEVLTVVEVDEPVPGPGQVLLRTEAVAGSYVDTVLRAGTGPFGRGPLPGSPHGEVVGTVAALGPEVGAPAIGQRVAALAESAYADAVVVDADACVVVPAELSVSAASTLGMAAACALIAVDRTTTGPDDTVLVQAAAGSIGHLAVQLARLRGARRVIGLVGSAAKREAVASLGADPVSLDGDWAAEVRALAPDGLSVVIDSIGGDVSATSLDLLAPFGRMVVYGAAGGTLPSLPASSLMGAMRTVTGFGFLPYRSARPDAYRAQVATLVGWLATGALRVWTQETVALADAPRAHALLEDRSRVGRVLLVP